MTRGDHSVWLFPPAFGALVLLSLRTGFTITPLSLVRRADRPGLFWTCVGVWIALMLAAAWIAVIFG